MVPTSSDSARLHGPRTAAALRLDGREASLVRSMAEPLSARAASTFQRAIECHQNGRFADARTLCREVLRVQPGFAGAWCLLGLLELRADAPEEASAAFARALRADSRSVLAHYNLGNAHFLLGRHAAAIAAYDAAIALDPRHADALYNRGNAWRKLGDDEAAIASFDAAIALAPDFAQAHNNRANALRDAGRFKAAIDGYDAALARTPEHADALNNRGSALLALQRFAAAIASFDRAIAVQPGFAEAFNNRGVALHGLGRFEAAIASFERAIAVRPEYADAFDNRGNSLYALQRYEDASRDFDTALALQPGLATVLSFRMSARMHVCAWDGLAADLASLRARLANGTLPENPFYVLTLVDSGDLQRRAAEIWTERKVRPPADLGKIARRPAGSLLRVGYFSADYREHATLHLMAGLFESHDRRKFELTAFSFGPPSQDAARRRLEAACEVVDVREFDDREVAELARQRGIDVAVDLKGHTRDGRPGIFAHRAAPLQVAYLGYPGTMGAPWLDYLVADRRLVPPGSERYYREALILLPHSYQVNDARREIANRTFTRAEVGLPDEAVVFCCFNNNYKITPDVFASWMRILRRVEHGVLWLLEDNATAAANLRRAAADHGIDPGRLRFAPRLPAPLHLARHRLADLFLDTLPCNAHTTASDALWAGLPLLTCPGESFAARVAASLLQAVGLADLIAPNGVEYEEIAVKLGSSPGLLRELKARLERNRTTLPLFDTARTVRHLESAYQRIHAGWAAGLPPESLVIADDMPGY
jgi:predicted O-linked N-acetylglucosamine transferase (SPINDLY family)